MAASSLFCSRKAFKDHGMVTEEEANPDKSEDDVNLRANTSRLLESKLLRLDSFLLKNMEVSQTAEQVSIGNALSLLFSSDT